MSRRRNKPAVIAPTEAERELFRAAVADARPLVSDKVHFEPPPAPAIARSRERDEAAALVESLQPQPLDIHLEGGDELAYLGVGLPRSVLRDLRRGRWVTQAEIDLHGLNRDEARDMLMEFIAGCLARGQRCVRIVHGKGLGSPGREPVLKELVRRWLANRPEVLAYSQAPAADGGAGAVLVLLRARR